MWRSERESGGEDARLDDLRQAPPKKESAVHVHLALAPSPPSTPALAVRPPAMPPRTPLTPNQQRIRVRVCCCRRMPPSRHC
jgi:hypothetical protein